jgi:hypothetical protein
MGGYWDPEKGRSSASHLTRDPPSHDDAASRRPHWGPLATRHSRHCRRATSMATLETTARRMGRSTRIATRSLCTVYRVVAVLRRQSLYTWSGLPWIHPVRDFGVSLAAGLVGHFGTSAQSGLQSVGHADCFLARRPARRRTVPVRPVSSQRLPPARASRRPPCNGRDLPSHRSPGPSMYPRLPSRG